MDGAIAVGQCHSTISARDYLLYAHIILLERDTGLCLSSIFPSLQQWSARSNILYHLSCTLYVPWAIR